VYLLIAFFVLKAVVLNLNLRPEHSSNVSSCNEDVFYGRRATVTAYHYRPREKKETLKKIVFMTMIITVAPELGVTGGQNEFTLT
jgi:hypothetical protein